MMTLLSMLSGAAALPPVPDVAVPDGSRAASVVERCRGYLERAANATEPGPRSSALSSAERICKQIRMRDPAIDISPVETFMALLRDDLEAAGRQAGENRERESRLRSAMAQLSTPVRTNWSSKDDNARIEAAVRAYEDLGRQAREDLAALPDADVSAYHPSWSRDAEQVSDEIERLRASLRDRTFPDHAWNEALALRARFWVGQLFWPADTGISEALAEIEAFQTELGSREGAHALRLAAHDEQARQTTMPPAAIRDAAVEAAVRQSFDMQGWGEEVLAIHLQSSDWAVETNGTGTVVARSRSAWVAVKKPDGRGVLYDWTVVQPKSGSGWGDVRRRSHTSRGIALENVPR